ncbi:MAG: MBOAT family O-acyltransferase [Spirochaetota bacterium]|nr:MBOAT family O-acyltransferase [Spirochaetota bacterium]
MNIASIPFLIFISLSVILFLLGNNLVYRQLLLSFINLIFLITYIQNINTCIVFFVFILSSYLILKLIKKYSLQNYIFIFVSIIVVFFLFIKKYDFLKLIIPTNLLDHKIELIGISYMMFKLIHMIIDLYQNQLSNIKLLYYANYQLGFFSLLAGPIQRYNDFYNYFNEIDKTSFTKNEILSSWNRVLTGMFKMGLLSILALKLYQREAIGVISNVSSIKVIVHFMIYFYSYPIYVYLNFSGYCDIVIGCAQLIGLKLPENFNSPFIARNMVEFWNRWHITLSIWIRDYIFMNSYKWIAQKWNRHAKNAGYILIFITFFIAGVWHGSTWNFIIFGLIHGFGVAVTRIYGDILKSLLGRSGLKNYYKNSAIRLIAIFITFNYVCFSFIFFHVDLNRTLKIVNTFFISIISFI